jgi:hypothetical protein
VDRLVLVIGAVLVAGLVVVVVGRRTDPPASNTHNVPRTLNRADFAKPDVPWLVAVFTSATCNTCAGVIERARHLESEDVAVQELEIASAKAIHDRYRIDAVPTLVIADTSGTVQQAFLGPVKTAELWSALAELRG